MSTPSTTATATPAARPRRIILWAFAALVGLALLIVATVPPLRRYIANPAGQPAAAGVSTIEVVGDSFQNHRYAPSVTRVAPGTAITWTFNDRGPSGAEAPVPHNVIGDGWGSPVQASGSFMHSFSEPGVYRYTCTLHPGMDGIIEVGTP